MGKRRHTRPVGRPLRLLEEHVQNTLLEGLKLGVPVALACQAAGIAESSFYGWMSKGYAENEERALAAEGDEDAQPDETQQHYLDLFLKVQEARATAAVRNVGLIQKAAQGGSVTEKTVRKYRDPDTGELVEEETVKRSAPDWRAAAWYLERSHRGEFAKGAEQVEVTGANGGPIQLSGPEDLAARLSEHLQAGVAASLAALPAGSDRVRDDEDGEDEPEDDTAES